MQNYEPDVEVWWASHPYNPANPAFSPAPQPNVVNVWALPTIADPLTGETVYDLQKAINKAPDGTVFDCTQTAHPYGSAKLVGRSHLQFRGNPAGGTVFRSCMMFGGQEAVGYTGFIIHLHQYRPEAISLIKNPPGDYYFADITFDFNNQTFTSRDVGRFDYVPAGFYCVRDAL